MRAAWERERESLEEPNLDKNESQLVPKRLHDSSTNDVLSEKLAL